MANVRSPGVFLDGLQNFVEVVAELGDLSDPAFREWLAQDLKSQTDFRSKVRTPGRRAAPRTCICRSALLLAWLACVSFTTLVMLLYTLRLQLACRWLLRSSR